MPTLDPFADPVELTATLVDVATVSGDEGPLADAVEAALRGLPHLIVTRDGDAVVARTTGPHPTRTLFAGHLDTVPIAGNVPSRRTPGKIHGCGASDMKGALAVMLHLAATVRDADRELSFVFYDHEEVAAERNGLRRLMAAHPEWLAADLAVVMESTSNLVEAGCQGTLRVRVPAHGRRAHSARSWLGVNAIHGLAPAFAALAAYQPRSVTLDGCTYREGLNAVGVSGGVAGNVVPDEAALVVNFRFAPDRSEAQALEHVRAVLGDDVELTDSAPGALPRLDAPAAAAFVAAIGGTPVAKYGWTDVARFAAAGIPAVNYGPGEPGLAHTREEYVETAKIIASARTLRGLLTR